MKAQSSDNRTFLVLLAIPFLAAFIGCPGSTRAQESKTAIDADFRVITFGEAMKGQLIRSMPLDLAFPSEYEMLISPDARGVFWARPGDLDQIKRTQDAPRGAGFFFGRLTANTGYDSRKISFICGPDCDEAKMVNQLEEAGADNVKSEKHIVNACGQKMERRRNL